ncbi:ORF6N domain-containing protein [Adlercreutzia sp. ZJ304]|uniref:ORF6N domain-containing protein n=1 Tax=Adlercreutzia sp. ZJ304 TaxID=2709791 RepID=UPI00197D1A70|nr:ORF6N domain-containing protein [Adlercreutzia sp. ZJ304]
MQNERAEAIAGKEKDLSAEPMEAEEDASVAIVPANEPAIRDLIYTVRGVQAMVDSDLATLYGVETGNLNKAAGRNAERFPSEFRFKLTSDEWASLLFQIGRAKPEGRGGRRTPPYVYSEQGVAMLSAVLKSETAVRVSVQIMKSFVEMRHFIASNASMFEQVRGVELVCVILSRLERP